MGVAINLGSCVLDNVSFIQNTIVPMYCSNNNQSKLCKLIIVKTCPLIHLHVHIHVLVHTNRYMIYMYSVYIHGVPEKFNVISDDIIRYNHEIMIWDLLL